MTITLSQVTSDTAHRYFISLYTLRILGSISLGGVVGSMPDFVFKGWFNCSYLISY